MWSHELTHRGVTRPIFRTGVSCVRDVLSP